jgi:hypothetical protein
MFSSGTRAVLAKRFQEALDSTTAPPSHRSCIAGCW